MSRRMFWGETTYFVVDSILEECYYRLKERSALLEGLQAAEPQRLEPAQLGLTSLNRLETSYGLGLEADDVTILGKVIPLYRGLPDLQFPEDLVGVLEITVTVKVRSRGAGAAVVRQVTSRREFHQIQITGPELLTNYALFMKEPAPVPSETRDSANYALKIVRKDGTLAEEGRVFLGGDENHVHRLGSGHREDADDQYLRESGIEPIEMTVESTTGEEFYRGNASAMLLDMVWSDPLLQPRVDVSGQVDIEMKRRLAQTFVQAYFNGVDQRSIKYRLTPKLPQPKDGILNLAIQSPVGKGMIFEGRVRRLFNSWVDSEYTPGADEIFEERYQSYGYKLEHEVPASWLYSPEIFTGSYYPLFYKMPMAENAKTSRLQFLPFSKSKAYTHIFPVLGSTKAWDRFKSSNLIDVGEYYVMNVNGVMGILDDVHFDKKVYYRGQGAFVAIGNITFSAGIEPIDPRKDLLMILTRCRGKTIRPGHLYFESDDKIEAFLYSLSFPNRRRFNGTVATGLREFSIKGGLVADTIDINNLRQGSVLEYDPRYAQSRRGFFPSGQIHFYKIFNKEKKKIDPSDGKVPEEKSSS